MKFIVVDNLPSIIKSDEIYLKNDAWDDWFEFETVFQVYIFKNHIGSVRIGYRGQTERRPPLPKTFSELPREYFSLGTSIDYYSGLKNHDSIRADYLEALHDIAYDLQLFENVRAERVVRVSLLRDFSASEVKGQLHRIADGGAVLTNYDFKYVLPEVDFRTKENKELVFEVDVSNRTPSSNIHVLIGNNGVGKTTILKGMLNALLFKSDSIKAKYGHIQTGWGASFNNIVNISFSAFDDPISENDIREELIPYKYMGLIEVRYERGVRSKYAQSDKLTSLFFKNFYEIRQSHTKNELWKRSIKILESDDTFKELDILNWDTHDDTKYLRIKNDNPIKDDETDYEYKSRLRLYYYQEVVNEKFSVLSSGHKNILLTLICLINKVEEQTLVILDEPEEHLHPPLVSAFIRALSELLTYRNGVAIIATHSPVIVQEVPRKCVWKMTKHGTIRDYERPRIETFGANLGEITSEIFSYNVGDTGFHSLLKASVENNETYKDAFESFRGELGDEAKSILMSYMYDKRNV